MKIAIINQHSSAGGGARFVRVFICALLKKYPELEIGFFTETTALERDAVDELFHSNKRIETILLKKIPSGRDPSFEETKNRNKLKDFFKGLPFLVKLYKFFKVRVFKKSWENFAFDKDTIQKLNKFDLVYLSWPYFIEPTVIDPPIVATFHDFNFKYDFGNFSQDLAKTLDKQIAAWIKMSDTAVASTKFMAKEMEKFYPYLAKNKKIIYLAPFNKPFISKEEVSIVLKKYNLKSEYIICPANTSFHKNLKNLLKAYLILKKRGFRLPLVLTGFGTDKIKKYFNTPLSTGHPLSFLNELNNILRKSSIIMDKDIFSLGYLSNKEIDALISRASLVVSTSLYEAGSGPGLDAWNVGTPVAFSSIPPFLEQLDFLGTKAWVFDPNKPEDIAQKINQALTQKEVSKKMVQESKEAIEKYTWDDVATGYYDVFKEAIEGK